MEQNLKTNAAPFEARRLTVKRVDDIGLKEAD